MTPADLKRLAIAHFGEQRWQKELAAYLRSDVSTVRRWTTGKTPIPGPVEVAVNALAPPTPAR